MQNLQDSAACHRSNRAERYTKMDETKEDMLQNLGKRKDAFLRNLNDECDKIKSDIEKQHVNMKQYEGFQFEDEVAEAERSVKERDVNVFMKVKHISIYDSE